MTPPRPLRLALALVLTLAPLSGWATPSPTDPGSAPHLIAPPIPDRALRVASPDSSERARRAYELAARHFRVGRADLALPHALSAWHEVPNASSALIVATVLADLRRACDALPYLVLGLELDPVDDEPARLSRLFDEQAPHCPPGYALVTLTATPADAIVELGSHRLAPPRTVALRRGHHTIEARAPGHEPAVAHLDIGADDRRRDLTIALAPTPQPGPAPDDPLAASPSSVLVSPPPPPDTTLEWVLVGGGLATLAVGGLLYGLAIDEANTGDAIVRGAASPPSAQDLSRLAASHDRTRDLELAAWVTGGVGALSLATGLVLMAIAPSDDPAGQRTDAPVSFGFGPHGPTASLRCVF